jgi:transposase
MINLKQYGRLLRKYAQTQHMSNSALHAGVDRKTARKYLQAQQTPHELQKSHTWRTRPDPLANAWPTAQRMLTDAPELEAKGLFEFLLDQPGCGMAARHLRTFQRRVTGWRATHGPEKEVFFAQKHAPGLSMELDWTHARELEVSVQGAPLDHLLCHCVLPYSNWQWATRCQSESFLSLVSGLQAALQHLGKSPQHLGTDQSSAATHEINDGHRGFNADYLDLCQHYDLAPVTINRACPHEQGDVESQNGHLKRRLKQHLLLRGSRDFETDTAYDQFLAQVMESANKPRQTRLVEELAVMRPLPGTLLADYREVDARVSSHSTIRVKHVTYSVPSRLIGQRLRVQVYESVLKVYLGREQVIELARACGDRGAVIDFRHLIGPLLRKPGAFLNYQHREQLYPTVAYRAVYDRLIEEHGQRLGVIEYLHVLKLAADHTLEQVQTVLATWIAKPGKWRASDVRAAVDPGTVRVPEIAALSPDLTGYDQLLNPSAAPAQEVAYVG